MSDQNVLILTASQVLRIERARAEFARTQALCDAEMRRALEGVQEEVSGALASGGIDPGKDVWEIVESGDLVKLVRRARDAVGRGGAREEEARSTVGAQSDSEGETAE